MTDAKAGEEALVYSAIDIGRAGDEAFISYKVHNPTADPVREAVQIYVDVRYPDGGQRRRMVGWETHSLPPGSTRTVWIAECALALPVLCDGETMGGVKVSIQSLSVLRAQASWSGAFHFTDLKAPALSSAG